MTMTYAAEAVGIVRAAQAAGIPAVISFTVETDGCLPTGQGLDEAIAQVDDATGGGPVYYMINCAHPTHFDAVLDPGADWCARIRGIRLNASCLSHAELDEASELDDGNPAELGDQVAAIRDRLTGYQRGRWLLRHRPAPHSGDRAAHLLISRCSRLSPPAGR